MPPTTFADLAAAARSLRPAVAVVFGSGMGAGLHGWREYAAAAFADVPGLTAPTVAGHSGRLALLAEAGGPPVLVFFGRLHFYEGHPWERVLRPMHVAADLGVRAVLLTNAAGGIRDDLVPGSLMALRAHLRWNRPAPFPFPGPTDAPYPLRLRESLRRAAEVQGVPLAEGTYLAVTGPSYETPAEIRAFRANGADAVGMSTAHEAEAARALGLACAAVSLVTNRAAGLSAGRLDHREVLAAASAGADALGRLLGQFLRTADGALS